MRIENGGNKSRCPRSAQGRYPVLRYRNEEYDPTIPRYFAEESVEFHSRMKLALLVHPVICQIEVESCHCCSLLSHNFAKLQQTAGNRTALANSRVFQSAQIHLMSETGLEFEQSLGGSSVRAAICCTTIPKFSEQ